MPSKSQLTGQSDIWDLSDYFPPGEPWESSFNWYKPLPTLTSSLYPILQEEIYTSVAGIKNFGFFFDPQDYYGIDVNISEILLRDSVQSGGAADYYTMSTNLLDIEIRDTLKTVAQSDYYTINTILTGITLEVKLIQISNSDYYTINPNITEITLE